MKKLIYSCFGIVVFLQSCIVTKPEKMAGIKPSGNINVINEKKTVGNEYYLNFNVLPPLLSKPAETSFGVGLHSNSFNKGNFGLNLLYTSEKFFLSKLTKPHITKKVGPIEFSSFYSYPLIKKSKVMEAYIPIMSKGDSVFYYKSDVQVNTSYNLRGGISQSRTETLYILNDNNDSRINLIQNSLYLNIGGSYVKFFDHQSHLYYRNKEMKVHANRLLEIYGDFLIGIGGNSDRIIETGLIEPFVDNDDLYKKSPVGFEIGVRFSSIFNRFNMTFHSSLTKRPYFKYFDNNVFNINSFSSFLNFGISFGYSAKIKSPNAIF